MPISLFSINIFNQSIIELSLFRLIQTFNPLMRECLGSTPKAGKLDSGYHPSEVGEMSSNY